MKRPLFLVLLGLVSGETVAIGLNRNGFFAVMFLFVFLFFLLAALRKSRTLKNLKRSGRGISSVRIQRDFLSGRLKQEERMKQKYRFFVAVVLFLLSFFVGGMLFLRADRQDQIDRQLARYDTLAGTLRGTVDAVKKTEDGEYQITLADAVLLTKNTGEKTKTDQREKNAEGRTTSNAGENAAGGTSLRGKCRVLQLPLSVGKVYPGDTVLVSGTLRGMEAGTNPGQFPSKIYYYSLGVRYQFFGEEISRFTERPLSIKRLAYLLREKIAGVYGRVLAPEEEALLDAIVLGDKTGLSRQQKLLYEESGTAHLLAVSGLHVSIVGGSLFKLLRKKGAGYGVSCLGGGALLFFYGILTGFGNSVFRAVWMFAVFLLSQYAGAEYDMVSAMSLAGIFMLVDSPWRLLEGGCVISFLSVFAIGYILPWVREKLTLREKRELVEGEFPVQTPRQKKLREAFTASFVVSMVTGPLLLVFYYQWSPYSILLNLIVIPAMTPLMLSALLGGILGMFGDFFAFAACLPAFIILRFFNLLFSMAGKIPGSLLVTGRPCLPAVAGMYLLEILLTVLWYHRNWRGMAGLVFSLLALALLRPQAPLKVVMLDVGQGECIFVKMPTGESLLIDGGSTSKEELADYTIIPALKYYGTDHLDYVVITHTDEDHISGVEELLEEDYPIRNLLLADVSENEEVQEDYDCIEGMAEQNGVRLLRMGEGDALRFGSVRLFCLHPESGRSDEDKNGNSIVLYLRYGTFDALFTGDLNGEQETLLWDRYRALIKDGQAEKGTEGTGNLEDALTAKETGKSETSQDGITLLKTAHHGSKNSTTEDFLKKFRPENAIISAGKNNWYGHPHEDTLQRLQNIGAKTYATLWGGAILAETDGGDYEVGYYED